MPKTCCDRSPVWILDTGGWHQLGGYLTHKRAKRCHTYVLFRSFTLREETKALSSPDEHEEVGKTVCHCQGVAILRVTDRRDEGNTLLAPLQVLRKGLNETHSKKTTQQEVCGSAHATFVSYFESAV